MGVGAGVGAGVGLGSVLRIMGSIGVLGVGVGVGVGPVLLIGGSLGELGFGPMGGIMARAQFPTYILWSLREAKAQRIPVLRPAAIITPLVLNRMGLLLPAPLARHLHPTELFLMAFALLFPKTPRTRPAKSPQSLLSQLNRYRSCLPLWLILHPHLLLARALQLVAVYLLIGASAAPAFIATSSPAPAEEEWMSMGVKRAPTADRPLFIIRFLCIRISPETTRLQLFMHRRELPRPEVAVPA